MSEPQPSVPPAGWHPDPLGSGKLRYWDGAAWTEHLQDPALPPELRTDPTVAADAGTPGSRRSFSTRTRIIAVVTAVALILATGGVVWAILANSAGGAPNPERPGSGTQTPPAPAPALDRADPTPPPAPAPAPEPPAPTPVEAAPAPAPVSSEALVAGTWCPAPSDTDFGLGAMCPTIAAPAYGDGFTMDPFAPHGECAQTTARDTRDGTGGLLMVAVCPAGTPMPAAFTAEVNPVDGNAAQVVDLDTRHLAEDRVLVRFRDVGAILIRQ